MAFLGTNCSDWHNLFNHQDLMVTAYPYQRRARYTSSWITSGCAVIQDLSGSKKQLAPIVHDKGIRPIICR